MTALRTLLHHPELSQKVEDASHFAAEDNVYSQLLVALLEALQKNPKLRSLQLIATEVAPGLGWRPAGRIECAA